MLYAFFALIAVALLWTVFGRLDVVAVAPGKLVPQTYIKVVQPADSGIVREILVKEGDRVERGQPLMRLDARLSEADLRILTAELQHRVLQLRRIDAELKGVPMRGRPGDDAAVFAQVEAQYRGRRQAYEDALATERAVLTKTQQDLKSAAEVESKLNRAAPIYQEQDKAWDQLAKEGYAGRLLALERRRARIENEQDLKAQSFTVASLTATIEQSTKRMAQISSDYRQRLLDERVDAEAQRQKSEQELAKVRHRHGWLELRAPDSGSVKELSTHTLGTVVAPGTVLMTIVPDGEPLEAEIWVSNLDAGLVRTAQDVRVKLAAYPFQKYGMVNGTVRFISADATDPAVSAEAKVMRTGGLLEAAPLQFRALVALRSQELVGPHGRNRLGSGMQVNAEINLGSRTILEYLLSPVQKVVHEAARER